MGLDPKTIIFDPWNLIYHYNLRGIVDVVFYRIFMWFLTALVFYYFKAAKVQKLNINYIFTIIRPPNGQKRDTKLKIYYNQASKVIQTPKTIDLYYN